MQAPTDPAKRKRPTDKSLPKKLETFIPESALYTEMQQLEQKLDACITFKTLAIQDSLSKPFRKVKRTLRVFLSNFAHHQEISPGDVVDERVPSWTVKIEGKLLDVTLLLIQE